MDRLAALFGDSLAIVRYHSWWPDAADPFYLANPTEARERILYLYAHQANPNEGLYVPHFFVDMVFDADAAVSTYEARVRQALAVPSRVTMNLQVDLDFATRRLTVTCEGSADTVITDALRLRCALTESDLRVGSSPPFHQVMRDMVPSPAGVPVDLATSSTFSKTLSAVLDPAWEVHNLEVVAFLQEDTRGRVFQAAKASIPRDIPWFKLVSFQASELQGDGDGVLNPGEVGTVSLALSADSSWGAARNITLTLQSLSQVLTVTQASTPLPDMAPGDVAWVPSGVLQVQVSPQASFATCPVALVVQATYGQGQAYTQTLSAGIPVTMYQFGFPVATPGEILASPAWFRLPGTAGAALAVTDEAGWLHVLTSGGTYVPGFPVHAGPRAPASPAVADLDSDGVPELVVATWDGFLACFGLDSQLRWRVDLGGSVAATPAIGDVTGDGIPEVVAGTMGGHLWVLSSQGQPLPGWPLSLGQAHRMSAGLCLVDVDGDGAREVVGGTWGKMVFAFRADGTPLAGWPQTLSKEIKAGVVTSVLPAWGTVLLVPCLDDSLHVFLPSGHQVAAVGFGFDLMSTPAPSDLQGNGDLELVVATANGWVHLLDAQLRPVSGWPVSVGARVESSPVVADLDGDGTAEILVGTDEGKLFVFGASGASFISPVDLGARVRSTPAAVDLDGDRDVDVFVGSGNLLVGLDFKAPGGSVEGLWAQYRGLASRTGHVRDLGVLPSPPAGRVASALLVVHPIPARGAVRVSLSLPEPGPVGFELYDLAGHQVRAYPVSNWPGGIHTTSLDIKGVPHGVYLLRTVGTQPRATTLVVVSE